MDVREQAIIDYSNAEKLNLTNIDRWGDGIDHHPMSERLVRFLSLHDHNDYDDHFCWKVGGDGDNGESLMYQIDAFFELLDSSVQHVRQRSSTDCGIACVAIVTQNEYEYVYEKCLEFCNINEPLSQRELDKLISMCGKTPVRDLPEIYGELLPYNLYIMSVLPTDVESCTGHYIVVDTNCVPYKIYDPNHYYENNPPKIWGGLVKIK